MSRAPKLVLISLTLIAGLASCTREKPPAAPEAQATVAINGTGAAPLTLGTNPAITGTDTGAASVPGTNPTPATNAPSGTIGYTVQSGDTLNSLAQRYGTTADQLMKLNGLASDQLQIGQRLFVPTGQASTGGGQPAGGGQTGSGGASSGFYVVEESDTLNKIAAKLNISVVDLVRANNLQNADAIYIGQRLTVPGGGNTGSGSDNATSTAKPKTYTVKAGDTLASIAKRLGVSVDSMAKANNLTNPSAISAGQILVVPTQ